MTARLFDNTTDTTNVLNSKSIEEFNNELTLPHTECYCLVPEQNQIHRFFGDVVKFVQIVLHYQT